MLEDNLNTVSNLKKLTSKSQDNVSMIIVEFEYGSDLTEGANEIRDVVSAAVAVARRHRLSYDLQVLDLDDPRDHACRHGRRELSGLKKILDDKFVNVLNRVDGVGAVTVMGAPNARCRSMSTRPSSKLTI